MKKKKVRKAQKCIALPIFSTELNKFAEGGEDDPEDDKYPTV